MKQTTIWTIRLQLNSSARTAFGKARRNPTNNECFRTPELANVSNNIILYFCVTIVSDDANQSSSAKLLEEVLAYAKLFSQNISHPFSRQTIRVTAMTGAAAMEIGGVTTSEFHYMQNKSYATQDEIDSTKRRD
jgi:hypothetical protein